MAQNIQFCNYLPTFVPLLTNNSHQQADMNSPSTQTPRSFDIAKLPQDFGSGRLQNLILTFDNLEQGFPFGDGKTPFPVKCETFFVITLVKGELEMYVNLYEVKVKEGCMLEMTPGCIFEGIRASSDLRFFGMMIDAEFMDAMRNNVGWHTDLTHRYYHYSVHELQPQVFENHLLMYKLLRRELVLPDYLYKKEVIQRYCEMWVLKNMSLNQNTEQRQELNHTLNRKEQIFHDFLALLEQYFTQERSISFYAERMCLTSKYLSTTIKEVSGKHGMQWIDEYVSLEAKALLKSGKWSVKQVSDRLNFPSQSMFGRFFKKMTGYSPKQYMTL